MTQVDYDREMAFVAIRDTDGETVGVSRLVLEPRARIGEFAVIVQAGPEAARPGPALDAAADRLGSRRAGRGRSWARFWQTTRR